MYARCPSWSSSPSLFLKGKRPGIVQAWAFQRQVKGCWQYQLCNGSGAASVRNHSLTLEVTVKAVFQKQATFPAVNLRQSFRAQVLFMESGVCQAPTLKFTSNLFLFITSRKQFHFPRVGETSTWEDADFKSLHCRLQTSLSSSHARPTAVFLNPGGPFLRHPLF